MSIDKQVFQELVGELENYYKREFTPFVQRVWYKHLNAQITTDQFVQAIESAIVSKQFMPTPQELVEIICGDSDTQAMTEWDLCIKAASRADKAMLSGMSAQGQFALNLVGGLQKLGMQTEEQLVWIKKEFIGAWKSTSSDVNSLPASRTPSYQQLDDVRSLSQKFSLNGNGKKP